MYVSLQTIPTKILLHMIVLFNMWFHKNQFQKFYDVALLHIILQREAKQMKLDCFRILRTKCHNFSYWFVLNCNRDKQLSGQTIKTGIFCCWTILCINIVDDIAYESDLKPTREIFILISDGPFMDMFDFIKRGILVLHVAGYHVFCLNDFWVFFEKNHT